MLAIDGGPKVRETPFPKRHLFGAEEHEVALRLFSEAQESGNAIGYSGPEELAYEQEFAAFMGGGYADLVNSGTSALYAALGALKLEAAGEVVIPPITDPGGAMPVALLCQVPVVARCRTGVVQRRCGADRGGADAPHPAPLSWPILPANQRI